MIEEVYKILQKLYDSETLLDRMKRKHYYPIRIVSTIMESDKFSIIDKISMLYTLSNIRGYKNHFYKIDNIYNDFLTEIECNDVSYKLQLRGPCGEYYGSEIFCDLNDAFEYVNLSNNFQLIEITYFTIDVCNIHMPTEILYTLYGKYDGKSYIYDIFKNTNITIGSFSYINDMKSIFEDFKKDPIFIPYKSGDELYIPLSNGDFYHAIVSYSGSRSIISLNGSNEFKVKLLYDLIDEEYRICQSPVYSILHSNDCGYYYNSPNRDIQCIKNFIKDCDLEDLCEVFSD